MIAKLIGYTIGGIFVIMLTFGPLVFVYFSWKDTIRALSYDSSEMVTVTECVSERLSGNRSRYRRVPVGYLSSGEKVKGTMDEIRFLTKCNDLVGTELEVLFDSKKPTHSKFNTFFEMWFMAIVSLLVAAPYYFVFVRGAIKKYKKNSP